MSQFIQALADLFRFHKLKILCVFGFASLFLLLLFPFDDFSDLVTQKISEATGGNLYLQFDGLGLTLPPGLAMENVVIESTSFPTVKATRLQLSPWILGALMAKQGASVDADGIFGGNLDIDFKEGDKLKSGERLKNLAVLADKITLDAISDFLRKGNLFAMDLQGSLNLSTQLALDPLFDTQPKGNLNAQIAGFLLPGQTFNTQMGPLQTPTANFGKLNFKAAVKDGKLELSDVSFGGQGADLSGKIKGEVEMSMRRDNQGVHPVIGRYDLNVDLNVQKAFVDTASKSGAGLAFVFLEKFKQETPQGTRFAFRIKAANTMSPPELTATQ